MRYGLNYHPQFGRIDIEWVRRAQPPVMLVMDDNAQYDDCNRIHGVSPNTIIIHRRFGASENSTLLSASARIERYKGAPNWLYHNDMNEPDILPSLATLTADLHEAKKQNIRLCVGNFSTGTWQLADIDAGKYDDFLKALSQYRDFHVLGLHEYSVGVLPIHFNNGREPKDLIDPAKLQPDRWITKEQFLDNWQTNYHTGRYLWLVKRCELLMIPPPRIVMTEFGWDRNGDILGHVPELDSYAEGRITGQNSLVRYLQKVSPQLTFERALLNQLQHMGTVYTEHVIGACLYAWSHNPEWAMYNYAGLSVVLEGLALAPVVTQPPVIVTPPVNNVPPVVPFPTDGFTWRLIYANKDAANIRQQPAPPPLAASIAVLSYVPQVALVARSRAVNGWIPVKLQTGVQGWILDTVFDDIDIPVAPQLKEELEALRATLADAMTTINHLLGDTPAEKLSA